MPPRYPLISSLALAITASSVASAPAPDAPSPTTSPAKPAESRPATAPAELPPNVRKQFESVLTRLQDPDPKVRRFGAARARNLPGDLLAEVERAAKDPALSDEARAAFEAATPYVRTRARADASAAQVAEYDRRSALESYEKFGKKNPKWDAAVRHALELASTGDAGAVAAFKKAADAGCDDPYVLYLYARAEWVAGTGDREAVIERHREAAVALGATKYPAEWKCRAAARYLAATRAAHLQVIRICLENLPAALKETGRANADVSGLVDLVYEALKPMKDPQELFEQVYAAYAKARPANDPGPYAFKGIRYIDYAWEARGGDVAANVTQEGWKLFGERLAVAREAFEKAYEIDPGDWRAPTNMIIVAKGEGAPRREMEKWYSRAMKAWPDNQAACKQKMDYLLPRWHGSHAEMVAFGRECLATQDYWGSLPFVLVDAHTAVSKEVADPTAYFGNPGVWADIESVYRSFLDIFPDSYKVPWYRSNLAKWACECQQWDAARKAFADIGDKPDPQVFRSKALYDYYRRKAEKNAGNPQQVSADPSTLQ